ncbi:hypothetical protein POTOM_060039 [Populus tomentosa]|uniref:Uncharacterized protein n=1 Tax=Populus tomentosa TaxID=118781 RepID=A0A8X7Y0P5_POPTO|nr:hypothetical protein POTOM_060039 [Populus tomentosa]
MQHVLLVCFCCVAIFAIEELHGACFWYVAWLAKMLCWLDVLSEDILLLLGLCLASWGWFQAVCPAYSCRVFYWLLCCVAIQLLNWVCQSLVCVVRMFLAQRNSLAVCSWLLEFILALACFAAAICSCGFFMERPDEGFRAAGAWSGRFCPHYALYVDDMDSINLGEVLSPNAWTTDVGSSIATLLAFWSDLAAISLGSCEDYLHYALFVAAMDSVNLGEFISRWRVLDGGCPSLNKVDIVVLNLVGSALAAILWDPAETIPTMLSLFAAMDSVNLGEVLSPNAWATAVVSPNRKVRLKEIGEAFFLQFISRWRVLDGGCPSLNKVDIVVLIWSSGDDMRKGVVPAIDGHLLSALVSWHILLGCLFIYVYGHKALIRL